MSGDCHSTAFGPPRALGDGGLARRECRARDGASDVVVSAEMDGTVNRRYETVIGQQKSIALSDGSSIQMNTDSQVQVAYSSGARAIHLLKGEALFSVMPDPKRPFEVYAAESVVRAVGTAFAVHLRG